MTTLNVSTTSQLLAAMRSSQGGDTILLAPGSYSGVALWAVNKASPVTIQSADPNNPAVINSLTLAISSGFTFNDLNFNANGSAASQTAPAGTDQFNILSSQNITLDNINVYGDSPAAGGALATAQSGIYFKTDANVTLENSSFQYLMNAVTENFDNNITISNNSFQYLYNDGIDGGGDSNVTISANTFDSLNIDPTNALHADAIQFWTANTSASAKNITIDGNTFTRGSGGIAHGIYLYDESGGRLPYQNVEISNNSVSGAGWDGISVYSADNVQITNNTVTSYADQLSWMTVQNANGVTFDGNSASEFVFTPNDTNLEQSNNTIIPAVPIPVAGVAQLVSAMATFAPASAGWTAAGSDASQGQVLPSLVAPRAVA